MINLHLGDCLKLMAYIPDKYVDMILCDLPYGTTACKWDTVIPFEPLWEQYKRVIKDRGAIVLTASQPFTSALVMSNVKMFKYSLVWNKKRGMEPQLANIRPMKSHEDITVFCNGKTIYNPQKTLLSKPDYRGRNPVTGGGQGIIKNYVNEPRIYTDRFPLSIIDIKGERGYHPTQKPVALMEYLIKTYTNEGDLVLDNCMGSGTTGVACLKTGRRFIGIEKDEDYYKGAVDRLEKHKRQGMLFTPEEVWK